MRNAETFRGCSLQALNEQLFLNGFTLGFAERNERVPTVAGPAPEQLQRTLAGGWPDSAQDVHVVLLHLFSQGAASTNRIDELVAPAR